jgi:hypothetical protein
MMDKVKFELEFVIQSSPQLLYQYLSTPSGLSEWFADNVNSRGETFNFIWDGSEEQAKLLKRKSDEAKATEVVEAVLEAGFPHKAVRLQLLAGHLSPLDIASLRTTPKGVEAALAPA